MPLEGDIQSLNPGAMQDLFEVDVSRIDDTVVEPFRFVPATSKSQEQVLFRGKAYLPMPIEVTGFKVSIRGALPRPTLRVSNFQSATTALLANYNDFQNARLKRIRTFVKYLDEGDTPDPLAVVAEDEWVVDQKTSESITAVEFALASVLDVQGQKLPGRFVFHNACPFVYEGLIKNMEPEHPECPYADGRSGTATNMFTVNDDSTLDPDLDVCGKRLTSCEKRFGEGNNLPFGGMPGAQRVLR